MVCMYALHKLLIATMLFVSKLWLGTFEGGEVGRAVQCYYFYLALASRYMPHYFQSHCVLALIRAGAFLVILLVFVLYCRCF